MKYPQILIYERDRQLAASLQELAESWKWILREVRSKEEVFEYLKQCGPTTFVLKMGSDLENELRLVHETRQQFSQTHIVVIGEPEHGLLAGVAWDLGASYVLLQPFPRDLLPEIIEGFMDVATLEDHFQKETEDET